MNAKLMAIFRDIVVENTVAHHNTLSKYLTFDDGMMMMTLTIPIDNYVGLVRVDYITASADVIQDLDNRYTTIVVRFTLDDDNVDGDDDEDDDEGHYEYDVSLCLSDEYRDYTESVKKMLLDAGFSNKAVQTLEVAALDHESGDNFGSIEYYAEGIGDEMFVAVGASCLPAKATGPFASAEAKEILDTICRLSGIQTVTESVLKRYMIKHILRISKNGGPEAEMVMFLVKLLKSAGYAWPELDIITGSANSG